MVYRLRLKSYFATINFGSILVIDAPELEKIFQELEKSSPTFGTIF
jgi:hypothetical protein